ncbi:MAG: hypothetical protein EOO25_13140 [Comamonadaceae bacterium]|nr:MAG: hypothetical protein EOO25_13140 [Comamonadaceae bacterium]
MGVQIGLDAGADAASMCVDAEVFYADNRIDSGRVTTRVESSSGSTALVRVRSTSPVDEPVVTVYVRIGCSQRVTRRYVMLAEQPGELPQQSISAPAPAEVPTVAPAPAAARPRSTGELAPAVAGQRPSGAEARAARAQAREEARAARAAARAQAAANAPAQPAPRAGPRLKLEPLDLTSERDPSLRASSSMAAAPEATPQRRAEAMALWQALNAQPEDILRNMQRIQTLEGDVKTLRDGVQKNDAGLAALRAELEKAQGQRTMNFLVYGLLALLVLAALAAAFFTLRRRRASGNSEGDWWRGGSAAGESDFGMRSQPASKEPVQGPPSKAVDLDLSFTESVIDHLRESPLTASGWPVSRSPGGRADSMDFAASQVESLRSVKAEELHDIQQQADFFVSLGEHDQAIEVLRSHINSHPETSVVAWLDLLEIYHKLQRREDYESTREEFHSVFNAQVPSFDAYREETEGLQAYHAALSRIVALWPSPKVLDVIEESIFRKPGQGSEAFGLEAYRELLMLYHIGKDVIEAGDSLADFGPSSGSRPDFSHTSIHPLSASIEAARRKHIDDEDATAIDFPRIGLDINLDDPAPPTAELEQIGSADPTGDWQHSNMVDFDLPDIDLPPEPKLPRS